MERKTDQHVEEMQPSPQARADFAMSALMVQFLAWLAERPRTRSEVMDAWRSTCPRLTVWEDAIIDGLVQLDEASTVSVTARGRALLQSSAVANDHVGG
jgi:hypothetical protein